MTDKIIQLKIDYVIKEFKIPSGFDRMEIQELLRTVAELDEEALVYLEDKKFKSVNVSYEEIKPEDGPFEIKVLYCV